MKGHKGAADVWRNVLNSKKLEQSVLEVAVLHELTDH